jgi:hypothetical protein
MRVASAKRRCSRPTRCGGPRRSDWRHRLKHAATRLPLAGPLEAHVEFLCSRRRAVETCVSGGRPGTKLQPATRIRQRNITARFTCHCSGKAGYIYPAPPYIFRVALLLLNAWSRQGRRRPTQRFRAAGAGGVTNVKTCVGAAAKLRPTT